MSSSDDDVRATAAPSSDEDDVPVSASYKAKLQAQKKQEASEAIQVIEAMGAAMEATEEPVKKQPPKDTRVRNRNAEKRLKREEAGKEKCRKMGAKLGVELQYAKHAKLATQVAKLVEKDRKEARQEERKENDDDNRKALKEEIPDIVEQALSSRFGEKPGEPATLQEQVQKAVQAACPMLLDKMEERLAKPAKRQSAASSGDNQRAGSTRAAKQPKTEEQKQHEQDAKQAMEAEKARAKALAKAKGKAEKLKAQVKEAEDALGWLETAEDNRRNGRTVGSIIE